MLYIFLTLFCLLRVRALDFNTTLSLKPARQKPEPPLWGGSRRWASLDNIMESPEVTNSSVSWRFSYIYDSTTNTSAWLHHKGQRDWVCKQGSPALTAQGASCNVIHSSDGWLYIEFPGQQKCCKCTDDPSMGSVRVDWLRHPETVYRGVTTINGIEADHWFLDANYTSYDNNYYCTRDQGARPLRFMEHVSDHGGKPKIWDFNSTTYVPSSQWHFGDVLSPPANCEARCEVLAIPGGYPGCTWKGRGEEKDIGHSMREGVSARLLTLSTAVFLSVAKQTPSLRALFAFPDAFYIRFAMTDGSQGDISYDWPHLRQRVRHWNNSRSRLDQCFFWYNTTDNCTEYFNSDGEMYVDIPAQDLCCVESCAHGCREHTTYTPRPDFVSACNYTGRFLTPGYAGHQYECDRYQCPSTFEYDVEVGTGLLIKFGTADKKYVVLFDPASFKPGPQPPDDMRMPARCSPRKICTMGHGGNNSIQYVRQQ